MIATEIANGVKIFDKTKPTCLATHRSRDSVSFWLFHRWKIILVGSRFTHPAESRHAQIEGEPLAVADAHDKARHFVFGCTTYIT